MSAQRRLSAFFHLIEQDIEAAETLAQKKNHYAAILWSPAFHW